MSETKGNEGGVFFFLPVVLFCTFACFLCKFPLKKLVNKYPMYAVGSVMLQWGGKQKPKQPLVGERHARRPRARQPDPLLPPLPLLPQEGSGQLRLQGEYPSQRQRSPLASW